jgi:hypothetical protein
MGRQKKWNCGVKIHFKKYVFIECLWYKHKGSSEIIKMVPTGWQDGRNNMQLTVTKSRDVFCLEISHTERKTQMRRPWQIMKQRWVFCNVAICL